jgi:hypothetical protein
VETLMPRGSDRQWPLLTAGGAFIGFNFYLWTRPITQGQLCLISVPLAGVAFAGFMWHLLRE